MRSSVPPYVPVDESVPEIPLNTDRFAFAKVYLPETGVCPGSSGGTNWPETSYNPITKLYYVRVSDSCGYAVPMYAYEGQRSKLIEWADHHGAHELAGYRARKNARSIDGLPAFDGELDPALDGG